MAGKRVVLGALLAGVAAGAGLVAGWVVRRDAEAASPRPRVVAVLPAGATTHRAIPGRVVQLKAILAPLRPGRVLRYRWEFGDGQRGPERQVTDPYAIDARHVYAAPAGARFEARLVVTDAATGEVGEASYPVEVVTPTLEALSDACIDEGLWALHRSMSRRDDPLQGPVGSWQAHGGYHVGVTAMATLAFVVNGFDLRPERAGHPYTDTVERGLRFLACYLVEHPAPDREDLSDVDLDGDRRFLTVAGGHQLYEAPLVALALVGAQAPDRLLGTANPVVAQRTTREVVRDLLDFVLLAQRDARAGRDAGGWRYTPGGLDADMSVVQWPALALRGAEELWGMKTPEAARTRLEGYLDRAQRPDGGFGYFDGRPTSLRLTGAGLIGMACAGVEPGDPRVARARELITASWGRHANVGDDYAMYAVMKGATLLGIDRFGDHDWRREYTLHLARVQAPDGTFPYDMDYGRDGLATAWPCLILAHDVFCSAAPVTSRDLRWTTLAGGVVSALLGGMVVRRLRRRGA